MVTVFRSGKVCLKRLGEFYFVLLNGANVFEVNDYQYDKALAEYKRVVAEQK